MFEIILLFLCDIQPKIHTVKATSELSGMGSIGSKSWMIEAKIGLHRKFGSAINRKGTHFITIAMTGLG